MDAGDNSLDHRLARFYHLEYRDYSEDLDFYVQYASFLDPTKVLPILELGCGTGRVSIALAEAGFQVTAVDKSPGMLDILVSEAARRVVYNRITPARADMRSLHGVPTGPYNITLCALNTFAYLTTTDDQLAMLTAVRPLLVQHGILILDLTPPWSHLLPPSDGEVLEQGTYRDEETGATVRKLVSGLTHPATQSHDITISYVPEKQGQPGERIDQRLTLRWTGRDEMEQLLRKAGYHLEKLYGDYDLGIFTDHSERMVFVART
jgi:phospholipid N-methyltransferase